MDAIRNHDWFQRAALERVLPFSLYIAFLAIADVLARLGVDASSLRWLYGLKIALVALLLWQFRHGYRELQRPLGMGWRDWLLAIGVGVAVFAAWINLDARWMTLGGAGGGFDPTGADGIDWPLACVRLAGAALVVPLMEELFWRSFLLRWIDRANFLTLAPAQASLKAFGITVLFFAFEHDLWLAGLLAGAAYSLLYMRSGSLWSPIAAHAVTNALLGLWVLHTGSWHYW